LTIYIYMSEGNVVLYCNQVKNCINSDSLHISSVYVSAVTQFTSSTKKKYVCNIFEEQDVFIAICNGYIHTYGEVMGIYTKAR
jgi:hypothetical protein